MLEKKNLHYKGDIFTILRGSKVRCLKPPKPVPDPKNQKIQKIIKIVARGPGKMLIHEKNKGFSY